MHTQKGMRMLGAVLVSLMITTGCSTQSRWVPEAMKGDTTALTIEWRPERAIDEVNVVAGCLMDGSVKAIVLSRKGRTATSYRTQMPFSYDAEQIYACFIVGDLPSGRNLNVDDCHESRSGAVLFNGIMGVKLPHRDSTSCNLWGFALDGDGEAYIGAEAEWVKANGA